MGPRCRRVAPCCRHRHPAVCSSLVFLVVHCTRFLPCKNSRSQRHGQVLRPSSSGPCSSKTTCDPPCEQRWGEVRPGRRAFPWLSLPSCSTGPSPRSGPRPRQCCSFVRPVLAIIVPRPRRRPPSDRHCQRLPVVVVGSSSSGPRRGCPCIPGPVSSWYPSRPRCRCRLSCHRRCRCCQ